MATATTQSSFVISRKEAENMQTPLEVKSTSQYGDTALQAQFASMWNVAIDDFNQTSNTDSALILLPELKTCTISQLCARIDAQGRKYKNSTERQRKIITVVKEFLGPVQAFSNVAGQGASIVSY
jgi:hypothetical protein